MRYIPVFNVLFPVQINTPAFEGLACFILLIPRTQSPLIFQEKILHRGILLIIYEEQAHGEEMSA